MKLKKFLQTTKISIAQFAKNTGINENTLNTYVNKRCEPSVTNAIKIIAATHGSVTLEDLKLDNKERK